MPTSSPIPAPATAGRPSAPGGTIVHRPTIAVGVGSDRGWAALGWAVSEAAATGGRLVVCHVVPADSPLANRPGGVPLSLLELVAPALARAVAAARTRLGGNRVTLTVRAGRPGKALVSVAADARMLALGAPENSDWALRASTTHRVVTRAECPVIVVRGATGDARAPFAGQLVAGVDGSAPSRAALAFGFAYAHAHRLPLAAVHVTGAAREDVWFDDHSREVPATAEPGALRLLAEEIDPWLVKYPDVAVKRAVYAGAPLPGLLRAGEGARLLVVGDRGRGRAARAVLGSVSHGAVDRATGPVCVVPGDDRRMDLQP